MIYLNGTPLNVTTFPDKTSQVWKIKPLGNNQEVEILWEFSHEGEFMHLAQLKMLLDKNGYVADLKLKYLPYGRQDKKIDNESTFALNTFAQLINNLKFRFITICDPHSSTALELIHRSEAIYPKEQIEKVMELTNSRIVCYPDKGAVDKYTKIYPFRYIYGEKVRDQLTGNITNYKVVGTAMFENVLIIDDICDGGMTFKLLAEKLLRSGVGDINLFVTHGLFTKGLQTLLDSGIEKIYTQEGEACIVNNNITYRRL